MGLKKKTLYEIVYAKRHIAGFLTSQSKVSELTFAKAISTAVETEGAARVAKETVYGAKQTPVHKIQATKKKPSPANPNPEFQVRCSKEKRFSKGDLSQVWQDRTYFKGLSFQDRRMTSV